MRILFLTHPYPNYVPDLLLHGLRKLLGGRVVDYPKKNCLYEGVLGTGVADESQLIRDWFPPDEGIDRDDIEAKIARGYFDYIIADLRAVKTFFPLTLADSLKSTLVVVDGEDVPSKIPFGRYIICRRETDGSDFSIPLPMALPEEVYRIITTFDTNQPKYTIGFLGSSSHLCDERKLYVEAIASRYPDTLLRSTAVPSEGKPMPEGRLGRLDYYSTLQSCKMVLNLRGAGYDTFRFWENSACKAVHLSQRLPLFIPNDFVEGKEILRFSSLEELYRKIDAVLEGKVISDEIVAHCRYKLLNHHLTTKRAEYLLRRLKELAS